MASRTLPLIIAGCAIIGGRALRSCDDVARALSRHADTVGASSDELGTRSVRTRHQDSLNERDLLQFPETLVIRSALNIAPESRDHEQALPAPPPNDPRHATLTTGDLTGDLPARTMLRLGPGHP